MSANNPETLSYCVATDNGGIQPPFDDEQDAGLERTFFLGATIGQRYLLQSSLGRGGMGRVFLARDERLDRLVAVKVMSGTSDASRLRRQDAMVKEARLGALLNHPGIATVFDFGVHASRFFTIFEYIEGLTLRDVLNRRRTIALEEARQILGELSLALDYAHSSGIVHRDLKPENICIAKSGQLKILDLGVARDLRRDFDAQGFVGYQPDWRSMLGAAAVVEFTPQQLSLTVARLAAGLEALGFHPDREPGDAGRPPVRDVCGQVWATDANQIGITDLPRLVFKNAIIEDFLSRRNKCFVSATKGLGKTLLLTYKRYLLAQACGAVDGDKTICMVPQGRPYLDFMSELKSLSRNHEKPLSDLNTTKRIWSAALRISLISHHPSVIDDSESGEIKAFPERVQRWMRGSRIEPTVVFKELTGLSISNMNQLIDDTENFLDQRLRMVHEGTFFFIDNVDQAVRRLSRAAWIAVQAGLVEAAWEMMNANSHVKVFATIRQEAFANYGSDIKSNLFGATTILRYNETELLELMDTLSRCYEASAGFKDFIGFNVVRPDRRPFPEDSFQYVRRHTLGRPRDFVAITSELSSNRAALNEKRFCGLVHHASASGLVSNVFDEMQVFLDCLQDKATRLEFLRRIPANILSREEAIGVSARFNGLPPESMPHYGEESGELFHPFRDLYMCGLLGVIVRDPETGACRQKFRLPDDIVSDVASDLPVSPYYFIHPALSGFITHHRATESYYVFRHVLVGENARWQACDGIFCQLERLMASLPSHELRNGLDRILREARSVLSSGTPKNLRRAIEAMGWSTIEHRLQIENRDELLLWMEELFTCS